MQNKIQDLENRIKQIEKRNISVETDKAWETSILRKISIVLFTYLVIGVYMTIIETKNPWINAIVPVLGFLLSTLSISGLRKIWLKVLYKKD